MLFSEKTKLGRTELSVGKLGISASYGAPEAAYDMPLIAIGREDLYFTVSPSLYMDKEILRAILYDHLYSRKLSETYDEFSQEMWKTMGEFYKLNRKKILGVGSRYKNSSFWYPDNQVELPPPLRRKS